MIKIVGWQTMTFSIESEGKSIWVGIGEIAIGFEGDNLRIPSLGSCVGLVFYPKDKKAKRCAVMSHIMLPSSNNRSKGIRRFGLAKYADEAVPKMIEIMKKQGFSKDQLLAKMAGGAEMFGTSTNFQIGKENVIMTKKLLKEYNIPLVRSFTGGNIGISVCFVVSSYNLFVRPTGDTEFII